MKEQPGTAEVKGTGLGLSLSREFIKLHGGRIRAEGEEGKGSTFYIQIPAVAGKFRDQE